MLAVDLVYQYRTLLGKCESGLGLDVDEMITLTALESSFAPDPPGLGAGADERRFRREKVDGDCRLRGPQKLNDRVRVAELGPGGMVCRQTPYVEEGTQVEVLFDDGGRALSYRFTARVAWLREDAGDDFAIGLEFVGVPLLVHYGPVDHQEDAVDKIDADRLDADADKATKQDEKVAA